MHNTTRRSKKKPSVLRLLTVTSMDKISVSSLGTPDHSGYMTKQGGSYKSWKRRWFVLKTDKLYYFKGKKDPDITGVVELSKESQISKMPKKRSKHCFSIICSQRTFYMYPDTGPEADQWISALTKNIDKLKNSGAPQPKPVEPKPPVDTPKPEPQENPNKTKPQEYQSSEDNTCEGVRLALKNAKELIPFIQEASEGAEDGKIFEFWAIWAESIPPGSELTEGSIIFEVAVSADMDKLSWRSCGPQNIFIQRMVDFFWNVGAPETEIDRLNDVGSDMNPLAIGSWIDMSSSNGMDGGWYFPVEIPMKQVIEASDPGEAVDNFERWVNEHAIDKVFYIGRDMGAAPPRQTEVKFHLPGANYEQQLECGLTAYGALGVPPIPPDALAMISQGKPKGGLTMSVVTSSEGIVRLGILFPSPSKQVVASLSHFSGVASPEDLHNFEAALQVAGPTFVEFQCLMKGFGYGVYKEGFDIIFHYQAGVEYPK